MYFKTFIVILLFWTITLCNSNLINLVKFREIFDDGQIVTFNSVLEKGSTDTSRHQELLYTSIKCMYADTIIDLLQTFFEIFLYGVNFHENIHVPDINGYTKNWLISAIIQFNGIKPPIAKMIDDLFLRSDESKLLRTTDQSLLKSLLSINLFLYHSINDKPFIIYSEPVTNNQNEYFRFINDNDLNKTIHNIRVLNTSIIQMIGLVERFRSKRCVVHDPYKYNYVVHERFNDILIHDVRNITILLESSLRKLHILVNDGSDNYNNFNSKLYDPEYLLLENVLDYSDSFLGNIQIHFNGIESDLRSMYNYVKQLYSIEHVLEYQEILIKTIADVFYIQIYHLSNTNSIDLINDLTDLHSNFKKFTDYMLPSNCSINVCNKILKARVFLNKVLGSYDNSINKKVLKTLKNRFRPQNNIELINQEIQLKLIDPFLSILFDNIWRDEQHNIFKRVLRVLSYESYSNSDFGIVNLSEHEQITSSQSYDMTFFKNIIELQYALLAFWTLLKMKDKHQISTNIIHYSNIDMHDLSNVGFSTPDNDTGENIMLAELHIHESKDCGPIIADVSRIIVNKYKQLRRKPALQNILLPLLIFFQHTADRFHDSQSSTHEISMMMQITFLTITIVENYLIKNYSLVFYSLFIYNQFIMFEFDKKRSYLSKIRHNLHTYAEISAVNFDETSAFLNRLSDGNTYNIFLPEYDIHMRYLWNGRKQLGRDIFQNVLKGINDFNDLISLQWFVIKWLTSKILMNIMDALSLLAGTSTEEIFNIIKSKLNESLLLELPFSIKLLFNDIVNSALTILNIDWNDCDFNTFGELQTLFSNGLLVLDAHQSEDIPLWSEINEIREIMKSYDSNINKLQTFTSLKKFLGTKNILISTDISLSPVQTILS